MVAAKVNNASTWKSCPQGREFARISALLLVLIFISNPHEGDLLRFTVRPKHCTHSFGIGFPVWSQNMTVNVGRHPVGSVTENFADNLEWSAYGDAADPMTVLRREVHLEFARNHHAAVESKV